MKRFQFKLARLARVRVVQEEIARAEWQAAETSARIAHQQLDATDQSIVRSIDFLRGLQSQLIFDPSAVLLTRNSIERLEVVRDQAALRVDQARVFAAEARRPWQVVRTELEGLKRLEVKARTDFRIENEHGEAKQGDEVAMERAARKKIIQRRRQA
jgi:flagellar biosynthesis chaperone FliJ